MLSHHPNCDNFGKNHTINIGKYRYCIGCFIGYPSVIIGILAIYYLNLVMILESIYLFTLGMVLISFVILSPLNLTKIKSVKILQKVLIGVGSAFLFWWIWSLPNIFIINFLYFIMVYGLIGALLNMYHMYGLNKTCKNCEHSRDWQHCSGFKKIFECFKEHNLNNIF